MNGVPHCKAVVMTGENVSMDEDDEVNTADSDEMLETQEAPGEHSPMQTKRGSWLFLVK